MEETDEQSENRHEILEDLKEKEAVSKAAHLQPWQFKPGQSGNPKGRHPGKSLKEYAKEMLANMTEEERLDFMKGLSKDIIWKMAEGNPDTKSDITTKGEALKTDIDLDALADKMAGKLKEEKI